MTDTTATTQDAAHTASGYTTVEDIPKSLDRSNGDDRPWEKYRRKPATKPKTAPEAEVATNATDMDDPEKPKIHPAAEIFPMMVGREFDDLVSDIGLHGLREAIWRDKDNSILDGRNRYRACMDAGAELKFRTYEGDDPFSFVLSQNLHRRHLTESQRAMVAARIESLGHGGDRSSQDANLHLDRAGAAKKLNVSERSVASAKKVQEDGAPELIEAVEAGAVPISIAADVANLPQDDQVEIVARDKAGIREAAKKIRRDRKASKSKPNSTPVVMQETKTDGGEPTSAHDRFRDACKAVLAEGGASGAMDVIRELMPEPAISLADASVADLLAALEERGQEAAEAGVLELARKWADANGMRADVKCKKSVTNTGDGAPDAAPEPDVPDAPDTGAGEA
jgi:hypothetical protein